VHKGYTMHIFISFLFHSRWYIRIVLFIEMHWVCALKRGRERACVYVVSSYPVEPTQKDIVVSLQISTGNNRSKL